MARSADDIHDELLLLRCQDDEVDALEELVARWPPRLCRQARHLTGSPEAAWDVLQEVWMAMVRGLRSLDDPARFRPWAYRLVVHKSTDWVRRQQRPRNLEAEVSSEPELATAGEGDQAATVRRALGSLPGDRRAILSLHYVDDFRVDEIARSLRVPEGTVKSRLHPLGTIRFTPGAGVSASSDGSPQPRPELCRVSSRPSGGRSSTPSHLDRQRWICSHQPQPTRSGAGSSYGNQSGPQNRKRQTLSSVLQSASTSLAHPLPLYRAQTSSTEG